MDDRERIEAILAHPEAASRPALARRLALHSTLPVNEAVGMLRAAAVEPGSLGEGAPRGFRSGSHATPVATFPAPFMGLGEAVSRVLARYASVSGRARRAEYWWWILFTLLAGALARVTDVILFAGHPQKGGPVSLVFALVTFLPSLAVLVRRLHDSGRSGWRVGVFFLFLVPFLIVVLSVAAGASLSGSGAEIGNTLAALLGAGTILGGIWAFLLLIWCLLPSHPGENRYGANPLEVIA